MSILTGFLDCDWQEHKSLNTMMALEAAYRCEKEQQTKTTTKRKTVYYF